MKTNLLMKRLLLLWVFAFSTTLWGQGSESFSNITTGGSSYSSISWTGDNGTNWKAVDTRTDQFITTGNAAICIRQTGGKLTGPLTTTQQNNGIGTLTFKAKNTASAGDNTKATTYVVKCGSITKTVTVAAMGTNTVAVTVPDINATGVDAASIEMTISGLSGVRVTIDDLSWTGYSASSPNLNISGTPINHGASCVGTATSTVQYTITNGGTEAEGVTVASSGANSSDFVVSELSSTTIVNGGSATFNVTFTPSAVGARAAIITVGSTTGGSNSPTLNLTGTGNSSVTGVVSTVAVSNVGTTSAQLNGNFSTIGTCPATVERGFVWSSNTNPTIGDNSTIVAGLATGAYNYNLTGLSANNTYHYRAYIKDGNGSYIYGNDQTFSTLTVADHIAFVNVPATGSINNDLASFKVEARRLDNSIDTSYTGNVVLSKASGSGNISGTLTQAFVSGIAIFNNIKIDEVGSYTLYANQGGFAQITSDVIVIANPVRYKKITSLVELTDGDYIIVGNATNAMNTTLTSSKLGATTVSILNDEILNPDPSIIWKIETDNLNVKTVRNIAAGYVKGGGSNTNLSLAETVSDNSGKWAVSYTSNLFRFINQAQTSRGLILSDSPAFGQYATSNVNNTNYFYLTLYKKIITETTWSDTGWSDGQPTALLQATIATNYSGNSFESKSLTVNVGKTLTVPSTGFVKTGNVTNSGNILVANNGNFVQTGTFTAEAGSTFKVNRTTKPVVRLDYNSWSSPLEVSNQKLTDFSTGTLPARFLTYSNSAFVPVPDMANAKFRPGAGYLIRTPNNYTANPTPFEGQFEGTIPNSGDVTYDPTEEEVGGPYVFLGNPYPSAISMEDFAIENNAKMQTGTFYIWNSQSKMNSNNEYENAYISHTAAGSNPYGSEFYVPVGQGFIIDRGAKRGAFNFKNSMRRTAETGSFAKTSVTDRFWLQMTSPSGLKPQLLVAFTPNSTSGYDAGFDGKLLESNGDFIYSTVEDKSLIINALGIFSSDDEIKVSSNFKVAGNYTMSIAKKEGLFESGQKIYLKDNVMGTETELTAGDYTFAASAGLNVDRFSLLFTKPVLVTSDAAKNQITIYIADQMLHIKSTKKLSSFEVYEMSGKLIKTARNVNSQNVSIPVTSKGVVIVKMVTENGEVVTKKVILK